MSDAQWGEGAPWLESLPARLHYDDDLGPRTLPGPAVSGAVGYFTGR
jgi:hypothetical protein